MSELQKLSEFCEYDEILEDMLCDRLVCGLAEGDLTFDKVLKIAQAMELVEQDARDLQQAGAHSRAGVHMLAQPPVTPRLDKGTKPCYRCGGRHGPSQCRFRDVASHACRKKGPVNWACKSQNKVPSAMVGEQARRQPVHLTEEGTVAAPQEYTLYPLQDPATRALKTTVQVEDQDLTMEVDTGASVTIISQDTCVRIWPTQPTLPLHLTDVELHTYTG